MNCNVVVSERMNHLSFCLDRSTGRSTSALRQRRHQLAWETSHPIVRGVYVLMPEGLWNVWTEWSGVEWWKEIFIGSDDGVSAFCLVAMEMGSATGREMVPIARERRQQLDEFPPKTHFHYPSLTKTQ